MSQYDFGNLSSPLNGADFFDNKLEPWRNALHTNHSGSSRPSYAVAGMQWLDTTTNPWAVKWFTGSADIIMGRLNTSLNIFVPANGTLNNVAATTNPTVSNDGTQGYAIGSQWVNTTTGALYMATGVGTGAAVWVRIRDAATLIANADLATMAAGTVKANLTGGTAAPSDVTLAALLAALGSAVPQGHISGFLPSSIAGTATTASLTVSAGQAADGTAAAFIAKASTTSWLVSNGNAINGYQGGTTLPNSATIHFYACSGGSGTGVFASTSLTPTLPTGYNTYSRRIFSIKTTAAGALIPYVAQEIGGGAILCNLTTQTMDMNGSATTTAALIALGSVPGGVKMKARLRAISRTSSYNGFLVTSPDETDVLPTTGASGGYNSTAPGWDAASTSVAQGIVNMIKDVLTDTSAQVRIRAAATITVEMVTSAFEDFRR